MSEFGSTIAGGWLGAYYYDSRLRPPIRFEATFTRVSGDDGERDPAAERFSGTIVDDENGNGCANASHGVQQGNFVRFTKVYTPPAPGLFPIQYVGTLSEDGRRITGHWKISLSAHRRARAREITGTWEARRIWHAAEEEETVSESAGSELVGAAGR